MSQVTLPRFYFHFSEEVNIDKYKTSCDIELRQKYLKLPNMVIRFTQQKIEDKQSIYYTDLSDMVNAMPDGTVGSNLGKILFALGQEGVFLLIPSDDESNDFADIKLDYKIVDHDAKLDFIANYQINLAMNDRNSMQAFDYPVMVYTIEDLAGNILTCLFNITHEETTNEDSTDTIASNRKLINDFGFTINGKPLDCNLCTVSYFFEELNYPQYIIDVVEACNQVEFDDAVASYARILFHNLRIVVSYYVVSHLVAHFSKDYQIGFELELPENSKSKTYWSTQYPLADSCLNLVDSIWKAYYSTYATKSGHFSISNSKHLPSESDAMATAMLKLDWNLDFSNAKTTVKSRKVKHHKKANQVKAMTVNNGVIDVYKSISTPAHRKYFITDNLITYIFHRFADGAYAAVQIDYLKDKYNE